MENEYELFSLGNFEGEKEGNDNKNNEYIFFNNKLIFENLNIGGNKGKLDINKIIKINKTIILIKWNLIIIFEI